MSLDEGKKNALVHIPYSTASSPIEELQSKQWAVAIRVFF
jgi:hypothetical protein